MNKRTAAVLVGVAGVLIIGARPVVAKPCVASQEQFTYTPTAITWDGRLFPRSPTTGLYVNDAGIEFDVNGGAASIIAPTTGCNVVATDIVVRLTDPFTGQTSQVSLVVTP